MNPISVNFGLFGLISILNVLLWILGFICLIQLLRFLIKGIKALDIYIAKSKSDLEMEVKTTRIDSEKQT